MSNDLIKVLLVEDDEDDYFLAHELFAEIRGQRFHIDWVKSYNQALETMANNQHDICLVDYRLGAQNGIELLQAAVAHGCQAPMILLTGQGEHEVDVQAMNAGAADYLVKGRLDSGLLERSIRYAIERKRAAARAAAEQARLAAFGEAVGLALKRRDWLDNILNQCASAMVQYLNAALARIWIYEADGQLKLHASAGVTPALNEEAADFKVQLSEDVLTNGKPVLIKQLIGDPRLPDQEWAQRHRLVAFAGYPLVMEDRLVGLMSIFAHMPLSEGTLQEMGSVANGIALCIERKRSAEALGASESKYRSVLENIKEVIFQVDEAGRFTFLNPAWTEMTGFEVSETLGMRLVGYLHPEDRERHWELFQQLIQRKEAQCRDETRYLARDGTFRWVELFAQPIAEKEGFGASGTIRDITERKQAEAEIQKLAAFVRLNPEPVLELAADGTLSYVNPAAYEIARSLGLQDPAALLPADAATVARECLQSGQSKLAQEITINSRTISWSFFPIVPSQAVHCYGSDLTERNNLEMQLRHVQKLESVGQLAAGVAHDFNNILTIIQGHTDRLLGRFDGDPEVTEPLKQVSAAAQRGSTLTRQLLMFSRKQIMQPKALDLNAVLGNLTKMLHRLLGEDIALESKYAPGLPATEADVGMIEQVIMNLAVNSRDAMPKGGKLLITTEAAQVDAAYARQHPDAHAGQFVCLSVTDTGCGMEPKTLARIFEPFFTTKPVGKGTGLGLATVYGIVTQHQGWIDVSSRVGSGTTFKVYFPATTKAAEPLVEKPAAPVTIRGRHETILVVEDEPVLRELARMILKDYDYQVLEAATGVEALKIWDQHNGQVDLLLTDMVMPDGISGRELAEQLKGRKPGLKVIYTSGYSSEVMGQDLGAGVRFLQKPYPPPQLAQAVRECLDVGA